MVAEFWFYGTIVLICTGYALLMQSYPQWKSYFSIGLAGFIAVGGVLVYWDAKTREDVQTKMEQLERDLELAKKDAARQASLVRDANDQAHLLAEQLKVKTDELSKVRKDPRSSDRRSGRPKRRCGLNVVTRQLPSQRTNSWT